MNKSDRFARLEWYLVIAISCLFMSGCVTTTSGPPKAEPNDGDAAGINYQLAIEYYQNGNFELARDRLILSTELDPTRPIVWSTLATTQEQLGNLRLAEEAHNQALNDRPEEFRRAERLCRFSLQATSI